MNDLENRVAALEHKIQQLERQGSVAKATEVVINKVPATPINTEPDIFDQAVSWLKQDFLMKLGAFMLLLALAWFVRYSFAQNWLGPMGRISLGLLTGLGLLVFGYITIPKRVIPGQVLTATGATTMLITLSAAWFIYGFFDPYSVLGMMSLIVILTAMIAVVRNSFALAILALLGGAVVPFMAGLSYYYPLEMLSYILLLDLGMLLVVSQKGWRLLILLSIIISSWYSLELFDAISNYFKSSFSFYEGQVDWYKELFVGLPFNYSTIYIFIGFFFGLFFIANLFPILKTHKVAHVDLWTQSINAGILLLWINGYVPEEWKSMVLIGVTLLAIFTVYLLWRDSKIPHESMYIHSAFTVVAFAAAMAFELEGTALVIALAFESLVVLFLAIRIIKDSITIQVASFLVAVPILYSFTVNRFDSYYWKDIPLFNENFFVLLTLVAILFVGALLLKKATNLNDDDRDFTVNMWSHFGAACLGILTFIWLTLHNVLESQDLAREIALVVYALIGVITLFNGVIRDVKNFRMVGSFIIGGVVIRLLLVEVWLMPLSGRVVTFILVGLMLIATAFFQKNHLIKK